MKDELCKAFCDELEITQVPAGIAVRTTFVDSEGDHIGFYVVGPDENGLYRIEDDGSVVPFLEASGADLDSPTRAAVFESLLNTYQAMYDRSSFEIKSEPVSLGDVPFAALRFVNLLIRVQDLLFVAAERAASTFREDALREMRAVIGERAEIKQDEIVAPELSEYPADIVLRVAQRPPVAVFLCNSDVKVLEALLLHMASQFEKHIACSVVALIESDRAISRKHRQRASNHLNAVPEFRGDETQAIKRIEKELFGNVTVH